MRKNAVVMLFAALLLSGQAAATSQSLHVGGGQGSDVSSGYGSGGYVPAGRNNTGVVVDMPPEAWTQGQNSNQPPCLRCCTWENRSYTEGSVVKMEGILLQCRRDERSVGTNNLTWQTLHQN
ncbi:DUF1496 domain-containing protein [Erwinia sp. ErVv1]|uniref:DUF1496 domain-containing protein n=1 Tax=Erwinia sp. ErVv1 TaxID=1603299 RepID=UPI000834597C|nr:DUF1496 domain-containing protein [Erwinia sp. ErVv1]